jgi:hypothetical protein
VRGSVAVEAPEPFHDADALTLQATFRHLHERSVKNTAES